jgi:hypothetical protein
VPFLSRFGSSQAEDRVWNGRRNGKLDRQSEVDLFLKQKVQLDPFLVTAFTDDVVHHNIIIIFVFGGAYAFFAEDK